MEKCIVCAIISIEKVMYTPCHEGSVHSLVRHTNRSAKPVSSGRKYKSSGEPAGHLLLYFGVFDINSIIVGTLAVTYQANFHKRKPSYVCMYVVMNEQSVSDYWSYCMLICTITCEHNCWGWIPHFEEDPSQGVCRKKWKHYATFWKCICALPYFEQVYPPISQRIT